ncbi:hypothetical protein SNOG_11899 [Parastagonospora nodorum SN15]|uniref:Uncharacterized protein n=1 Tax=Phaeosphaeria nodorum (strain SN15 / ATCC MYA-4574 / FGSC 10173) TaxID=321614 RepID=Q0U8L5_PHANO|nr:hypothetical protein SNOG_11899 [Parastagonospora nodorum SN15]EAT80943.1 hypothetical protein SNOG_11899 [Parastagonospora nodorum SN15]
MPVWAGLPQSKILCQALLLAGAGNGKTFDEGSAPYR